MKKRFSTIAIIITLLFATAPSIYATQLQIMGKRDSGEIVSTTGITVQAHNGHPEGYPGNGPTDTAGIEVSPAAVAFGNQTVGTSSSAVVVAIRNFTGSALTLGSYVLSGANNSDFLVQNFPNNLVMQPDQEISFSVFFVPTAEGNRSASIVFPTSAASNPTVTIPVAGTGVVVTPTPTPTPDPTPTPFPGGTTAFTYQGKLYESGLPVTTPRDLKFKLFNEEDGTQIGADLTVPNVPVRDGVFTTVLDFGANVYSGAPRSIEISVSLPSASSFTTLAPRQAITAVPYAVRSFNSLTADTATNTEQLGGVSAAHYVVTTDPAMTNSRDPSPGSANYVQNQNASPQALANFSIDGTGKANVLDANVVKSQTKYNLGGTTILQNAGKADSIFVGAGAGNSITLGTSNTFLGTNTGNLTAEGRENVFIGFEAGKSNVSGNWNSFIGSWAGRDNSIGLGNNFFGSETGRSNTLGSRNNFFGGSAGFSNTSGNDNTFVGERAGAGQSTGSNNTLVGSNADVTSPNLSYATAIGSGTLVTADNTVVLGRSVDAVRVPGTLFVNTLGSGGTTAVCWNGTTFQLSTCTTPLAAKGTLTASSGAQTSTLLVNAIKEQQAQIEAQDKKIRQLTELLCSLAPKAEVCKESKEEK